MKLKEIKQHNFFSIIIISILITSDLFSFYLAHYCVLYFNKTNSISDNPYLIIAVVIFIFRFFNRYNPSSIKSRPKEIKIIFNVLSIITFLYVTIKILFSNINISHLQDIILLSILFFSFLIFFRLIIRTIQKQLLHLNIGLKKAVIIAGDANSIELIDQIKSLNTFGYNIVGYFSTVENKKLSNISRYLGDYTFINKFIYSNKITESIVTLNNNNNDILLDIISNLKDLNVCIKIIPDTYDLLTGYAKMYNMTGVPLIDINPNILTEFHFFLKRLIDIILSFGGIILFSPLFILLAIIIKMNSKGPVLFTQPRLGLYGKEFIVHKLRTMHNDSEKDTGPIWAMKEDPRITKIGRFLRKTRLDEFPQLYDVLIGNMSIVGPRPEREFFVNKLVEKFPYYKRRLNIRPGITGWAQIIGEYDTSLDNVKHKLRLDFFYIENISIWLDIKIMILTLWVIIRKEGH